jgi:hypothetical protein
MGIPFSNQESGVIKHGNGTPLMDDDFSIADVPLPNLITSG